MQEAMTSRQARQLEERPGPASDEAVDTDSPFTSLLPRRITRAVAAAENLPVSDEGVPARTRKRKK